MQMKIEKPQNYLSNAATDGVDIGLLDILMAVAENIKLLLVVPLLVGLCALGICFMVPQSYQSVSVLQADSTTASLMITAPVLDPVIAAFGLAQDDTLEGARTELRQQIKTAIGRSDKLLTVTVSARSPQQSQAIANALIQQTFKEGRPKANVRTRLETQLAEARLRLKNAQDAAAVLLTRIDLPGSASSGESELARGYAELLGATGAAQSQIITLEAQLEGLSEAQLVQSPTLPERASTPKKGLIAISATLGTGLAVLIFLIMRQAIRNRPLNETNSAKWLRIRKSFSWR